MLADILVYAIPAVLMILVTQLTRKMFTKYDDGSKAICNGVRWLLILVALIPIVNIIALVVEIAIIGFDIKDENIICIIDDSKFLKWWMK